MITDNKTLNIEKMISPGTLEAVIKVLSERQLFFQKVMEKQQEAVKKGEEIMNKYKENIPENLFENINYFQMKVLKEADKTFLKQFKDELINQPEIVEFLTTFTNEKWSNILDGMGLKIEDLG